jgi:glycosyltransferase involved in cell wall biosynthesis
MPAPPKISVVLTTHNRRSLLPRAIESVISQDEPDFELIIVDDFSTDGTSQYLATLTDARIRTIRPAQNVGFSAARNLGLAAATADIVAVLDDDDAYLQGRLSKPLAVFARYSDVVVTLSSAERLSPKRRHVQQWPELKMSSAAFEWAMASMILGPEGTSLTFRRKIANEIGGFNNSLLWYADMEFLIRLVRRGAGYLIADTLWRKFWSHDALTTNWSWTGPDFLILAAVQSEYFAHHRKLRTYLATKILAADLKRGLFGAFWRDLRNFRSAGFIDNNVIGMYRNHRELGRYRRKMSNPTALAGMTGPPDSWH